MPNQFYEYLIKLNEYERKQTMKGSLAIGVNDFEEKWRRFAEEFQFQYRDLVIECQNGILQVKLQNNKNIGFVGEIVTFQEEKILRSITLIASSDGTLRSGTDMLIAIGILIACLNPNEKVEFRKSILEQLGLFKMEMGMKTVTMVNDFRYSLNVSKEFGLFLSVARNK